MCLCDWKLLDSVSSCRTFVHEQSLLPSRINCFVYLFQVKKYFRYLFQNYQLEISCLRKIMKDKFLIPCQSKKISRSPTKSQLTHFLVKPTNQKKRPVDNSMNFKRNHYSDWTATSIQMGGGEGGGRKQKNNQQPTQLQKDNLPRFLRVLERILHLHIVQVIIEENMYKHAQNIFESLLFIMLTSRSTLHRLSNYYKSNMNTQKRKFIHHHHLCVMLESEYQTHVKSGGKELGFTTS